MKLADLTPGTSYFISDDKNWQETAYGRNGVFTGRNEGFRAEFEFKVPGLDITATELVSLPQVRANTETADKVLFDIRDFQAKHRAVDAKLRRMSEKVGVDGFVSTNAAPERASEFTVTVDKEAYVALLKAAHRNMR